MATTVPEDTGPQPETPRTPFQNGVRTSGRAFNSSNWRVKSEDSPGAQSPRSPIRQGNNSRSPFNRSSTNVPQAITEGRRLYVGNMSYMAKVEDVETLFPTEEYKIERIDISIDHFTGRNPSYCFVELATKEQADRAMAELDGKDLLGRPVKIRPGVAKSSHDRSVPRGDGTVAPFFDRWQRNDSSSHFKSNNEQGRRLYVGGLPRPSNQQSVDGEIRKFFDGYNIEAVSKVISPHLSKRFEPGDHYYLFVDFATTEEAQTAINTLDGQDGPWGGKLKIRRARGESVKVDERNKWPASRETQVPSATGEAAAAA